MTSKPSTPDALLKLWISIHGDIEARHYPVFKKRPELQELIHYRQTVLEKAFGSSPKLTDILRAARKLDPEVRKRLNALRNSNTQGRRTVKKDRSIPVNPNVLPLPGDPGATRRPGKKRERYRTGEEAELRHIAKQYKWWE
jgi:hypothetical protein